MERSQSRQISGLKTARLMLSASLGSSDVLIDVKKSWTQFLEIPNKRNNSPQDMTSIKLWLITTAISNQASGCLWVSGFTRHKKLSFVRVRNMTCCYWKGTVLQSPAKDCHGTFKNRIETLGLQNNPKESVPMSKEQRDRFYPLGIKHSAGSGTINTGVQENGPFPSLLRARSRTQQYPGPREANAMLI